MANGWAYMTIKAGGVYYIDTKKTHRTHAWKDNSLHLVMNIPKLGKM